MVMVAEKASGRVRVRTVQTTDKFNVNMHTICMPGVVVDQHPFGQTRTPDNLPAPLTTSQGGIYREKQRTTSVGQDQASF